MLLLAYGQFHATTFGGMLVETLPFFIRMIFPAILCYLAFSVIAERVRLPWIAIGLFIVVFGLMLPTFSVLGAYGPAHVGMDAGFWAWPFLGVVLFGKVVALHMGLCPRVISRTSAQRDTCGECGYSLAGLPRIEGAGVICPECGKEADLSGR